VLVKISTKPQEFRASGLKKHVISGFWRFKWTGATRQSVVKRIQNSSFQLEIPDLRCYKSRKPKPFVGAAL
jgi:hypothetical protein